MDKYWNHVNIIYSDYQYDGSISRKPFHNPSLTEQYSAWKFEMNASYSIYFILLINIGNNCIMYISYAVYIECVSGVALWSYGGDRMKIHNS